MEILIINGSPRTDGNTAQMCRAFAGGVESAGKNISSGIVNLYELDFKGCRNTYQFRDYSKYVVEVFSEPDKRAYREKIFPEELQTAFNLGRKTADTLCCD